MARTPNVPLVVRARAAFFSRRARRKTRLRVEKLRRRKFISTWRGQCLGYCNTAFARDNDGTAVVRVNAVATSVDHDLHNGRRVVVPVSSQDTRHASIVECHVTTDRKKAQYSQQRTGDVHIHGFHARFAEYCFHGRIRHRRPPVRSRRGKCRVEIGNMKDLGKRMNAVRIPASWISPYKECCSCDPTINSVTSTLTELCVIIVSSLDAKVDDAWNCRKSPGTAVYDGVTIRWWACVSLYSAYESAKCR